MSQREPLIIHKLVLEDEQYARRQRQAGLVHLHMSKRVAANPADVALCERVMAAAKADSLAQFEHLIAFPEVNALFCRGALYFKVKK